VESKPTATTIKNSMSKKWIIQNTKSTQSADYLWFEFTLDNKYIILKGDSTFLSGNYTVSDDAKTITLINYGVMIINTLADSAFAFTITLSNSSTGVSLTSIVAPILSTSAKTLLLCRNWKIDKVVDADTTMTFPSTETLKIEVVFSKYGTFFVTDVYTDGTYYMNRLWKWKDAAETTICYGDLTSDCTSNTEVLITELTTTSLVMYENFTDMGYTIQQTDYLSPVDATKSVEISTKPTGTSKKLRVLGVDLAN